MFTGIVEEIGTVRRIQNGKSSVILTISAQKVITDIHIGDSIAVNGVCLTVTAFDRNSFCADVMHETLNRSALGKLKSGDSVNLERAMAANGRFGGHIVSGHIDGTGVIAAIERDGIAIRYTIRVHDKITKYIVEKGSVAIDGISLTVTIVEDDCFGVSIIPHTQGQTTLSERRVGDIVNIENDIIGKYVERLLSFSTPASTPPTTTLTQDFLIRHGF